MRRIFPVTIAVAIFLFLTAAIGDVVYMNDGRKLEGKIVSETKDAIRLKMSHGETTIKRNEIQKIEKEETKPKDEIARLKGDIEKLKAENTKLRQRVEYLTKLCKKAGIDPDSPQKKEPESVTVYVTKTGKKYHREGCKHLRQSGYPISLKEAKDRGYTPCSHCNPPE